MQKYVSCKNKSNMFFYQVFYQLVKQIYTLYKLSMVHGNIHPEHIYIVCQDAALQQIKLFGFEYAT